MDDDDDETPDDPLLDLFKEDLALLRQAVQDLAANSDEHFGRIDKRLAKALAGRRAADAALLKATQRLYDGLEGVEKRVASLTEHLSVLVEGTTRSTEANRLLLERVDAMERAFRGRMN